MNYLRNPNMRLLPLVLLFSSTAAFAQNWEAGFSGGYALSRQNTVTSGAASAKAGVDDGWAAGAYVANDMYRFIGGEIRYTFQKENLVYNAGGAKTTLHAVSHAVHYDVLLHLAPKDSPVRPFLAFGAGVKDYRSSGTRVIPPGTALVIPTAGSEVQPLLSGGVGVKFKLSSHAMFRLDLRDYATPFPRDLLVPVSGVNAGGWIHNFVGLASVGATF
jgi:hypothetical protein